MFGASCFRIICYHHRMCRGGGYKSLSIPSSTSTTNNIDEIEEFDDDLNVSTSTFSSTTRASSSGASRVQVGEIYDTDSQTFDYTNLTILYGYLSSISPNMKDSSETGICALSYVNGAAEEAFDSLGVCFNASWMCYNGLSAGTYNGVSYVEAASNAEVTVSFCGFVWQAVMLSQDIYGNTILTLWLDNVVQDELTSYSSTSGRASGCINGTLYAPMQKFIYSGDYSNDINYQMRNNVDPDLFMLPRYIQRLGFSGFNFYMNYSTGSVYENNGCYSGLSKYVAFPYQIPWQQNQSAKEVLGLTYNLSNEACAIVSDDGFYSSENNYSNYIDEDYDYQWWAAYPLWLPSLSEIGYEDNTGGFGVTEAQRSSNANNFGTVGSSTPAAEVDNGVWTRSANYKQSYGYYFVKEGGSGKGVGALRAKVIRPAIHLNLTAIEAER